MNTTVSNIRNALKQFKDVFVDYIQGAKFCVIYAADIKVMVHVGAVLNSINYHAILVSKGPLTNKYYAVIPL